MVGYRSRDQPEAGCLGLLGRSLRTLLCAIDLDLIEVLRPFLACERDRRLWPELRWVHHRERLDLWPHRGPHDRRRHIDARRRAWPVVIGRVGAIVCPRFQDLCTDGLSELD